MCNCRLKEASSNNNRNQRRVLSYYQCAKRNCQPRSPNLGKIFSLEWKPDKDILRYIKPIRDDYKENVVLRKC